MIYLDIVPYGVDVKLKHIGPYWGYNIVFGINNRYYVRGEGWRYAVYEEMDCLSIANKPFEEAKKDIELAIELAKQASIEAFGDDYVAMVIATKAGYHIYLDLWTHSYIDSLLLSAKYRDCLPCACRDYRHVYYGIQNFIARKWERYILRVSSNKYIPDYMFIVYRRKSRDSKHEEFLKKVESLYSSWIATLLAIAKILGISTKHSQI